MDRIIRFFCFSVFLALSCSGSILGHQDDLCLSDISEFFVSEAVTEIHSAGSFVSVKPAPKKNPVFKTFIFVIPGTSFLKKEKLVDFNIIFSARTKVLCKYLRHLLFTMELP